MMETVAWLSGMPKKFAVKWIDESIYVKCSVCLTLIEFLEDSTSDSELDVCTPETEVVADSDVTETGIATAVIAK